MKFTEEKRSEIANAIQIRCSGSDYLTFQYEEIDRMVDDIDKIVNENNVIPPVSNWVEVSEPPTVNHFYLVYDKESGAITKALYNNGEWHTVEEGFDENITHWKELPKPPCR